MADRVRIGTRRSALALWQAEHIAGLLSAANPGLSVELVKMTTQGDRFLAGPLSEVGGKGLFTREIEEALLREEVDLAVHSLKDLPAATASGLRLAAPPPREDARDALCTRGGRPLAALGPGARVGTSSLRRALQLGRLRPDLRIEPVRGNVPTRLTKLEGEGGLDGVMLAAAGLSRLGLSQHIGEIFDPAVMLPAVGQGILGLEHREGDWRMAERLKALGDEATAVCARAERALLESLGAGCTVPLGGYATYQGGRVRLEGLLLDPASGAAQRVVGEGGAAEAVALGHRLGAELLAGPARAALVRG